MSRSSRPTRRIAGSPPKRRILVFTEGEATEVIYLTHLYREHRERVAVIIDNRHGTPLTIVRYAVDERERCLKDERRGRGTGYDSYWCVLDVSNVGSWFLGQSIHLVNGIVFGMLFALIAYKTLPTFFKGMKSVQKGLVFAVVQTIISLGFLFPYVYAPKLGFDIFSFGANKLSTNPDHWKLPLAVLIWHLVYGALLGLLYNPKKPASTT